MQYSLTQHWLTTEDLRLRLRLPSRHKIDEMRKSRLIPYYVFGSRSIRFYWPDVLAALERFQIKEIDQ